MSDGPRYKFVIPGVPVQQGSMVSVKSRNPGHSEKPPFLKPSNEAALKMYRKRVAQAVEAANLPLIEGPCSVIATFWMPRPAGHYGTGRNADKLRDSAAPYPSGPPDVDKLARALLDAIDKAGVIDDDSRVVNLLCYKRYAGREAASCTAVTVRPL